MEFFNISETVALSLLLFVPMAVSTFGWNPIVLARVVSDSLITSFINCKLRKPFIYVIIRFSVFNCMYNDLYYLLTSEFPNTYTKGFMIDDPSLAVINGRASEAFEGSTS